MCKPAQHGKRIVINVILQEIKRRKPMCVFSGDGPRRVNDCSVNTLCQNATFCWMLLFFHSY